jgi:Holliday junction resolvasome RuvABC endonuclease subunit
MAINDFTVIAIDSSTTHCGVAIFNNTTFLRSITYDFGGTYSLYKLRDIVKVFENLFCDEAPKIVLIETPVPCRNSKAVTSLNQVAGAISAVAFITGADVEFIHNKEAKKLTGVKTKEDSINRAKLITPTKDISEHEADAIMIAIAYFMKHS